MRLWLGWRPDRRGFGPFLINPSSDSVWGIQSLVGKGEIFRHFSPSSNHVWFDVPGDQDGIVTTLVISRSQRVSSIL